MSTRDDLHAAVAQRLFGFHDTAGVHGFTRWKDAAGTVHHAIPAYTTNPAATALVWQWLERQGMRLLAVEYEYGEETITCHLVYARYQPDGTGVTWPEALCRAALALAEGLERETR